MTRGAPTPPEKVEEVKAIAATTANLLETSRRTGVPEATVHGIVKNSDDFEEYRVLAQQKYIMSTWDNIQAISQALTDYITSGKLTRAQLRDLTGALKDLRGTVENVVHNVTNVQVNNQSVAQYMPEDHKLAAIEYLKSNMTKEELQREFGI